MSPGLRRVPGPGRARRRAGGRRHEPFGASTVLANSVIFGTVSAARRRCKLAVEVLGRAGQAWLGALISQRVPLSARPHAPTGPPGDVKVVVDLTR